MLMRLAGRGNDTQTALPGVAPGERVYAVGDIHGRADLLGALLERIGEDAEARHDGRRLRLIFLGDYVDRGDRSRETLDLLLRVARETPEGTAVFLRGNHEAALLDFVDRPGGGASWLDFGGRQTLASYGVGVPGPGASAARLEAARDALVAAMGAHLDLLRGTRAMARSGRAVFAHSGFDPALPDSAQSEAVLLWGAIPPENAELPGDLLLVRPSRSRHRPGSMSTPAPSIPAG